MKKFLTSILILVLAFVAFGCNKTQNANGSCKVVIMADVATEYTVNLDDLTVDQGVMSLLIYLKENQGLSLEYSDGAYGAFLTKLGVLAPVGNQYISVYTSVSSNFDVSGYAQSLTYKDVNLTTSGVGVSQMKVESNAVYYFVLASY